MGTIARDQVPDGGLYLNRSVYERFEELKSRSSFDTNHFLEQLLALYINNSEETKILPVRLDLALKFCSLQAQTSFDTNDDLMTHLLSKHSSNEKKTEPSNSSEEKVEHSRPKKNKRKPDFVQRHPLPLSSKNSAEKELPKSPSRSPSISFSEDSGCYDTSKEELKTTPNRTTSHDTSGKEPEVVCLDLTVVKKEKEDDYVDHLGACGKKIKIEKDPSDELEHYLSSVHPISRAKSTESEDSSSRNLKPNDTQTWGSNSVSAGDYKSSLSTKQTLSAHVSPRNFVVENVAQNFDHSTKKANMYDRETGPMAANVLEGIKIEDSEDHEDYNYVLNDLDSPDSAGDVEDGTPMKMPVKLPAIIPLSSSMTSPHSIEAEDLSLTVPLKIDEDEPQDLTSPQKINHPGLMPINHSRVTTSIHGSLPKVPISRLSKPRLLPSQRPIAPAPPVFKSPNGTLIGEPRVLTVPQSGQQSRIITLPINNGNRPLFLPTNAQQNLIALSPVLPPPGPPPKLIPASSIANLTLQPNMGTSTSSTVLVPVGSSSNQNTLDKVNPLPNGAVMVQFDMEGDSPRSRRKRRKMDDTTSFRDPPEQSLPFNGPNKYRFYCDVCETGFTRRYTFNRHRCKGKVEKHFCQLCDKAYLSKYKLKDHILVKHEGQTVSCPDCGKRFSSRSSMEMHKKQQHEGQFSIFCKVCGKGFNHTGHYYGHMNKHTNTKPFWCQKCGKRFFGSSYLHNHKQVCRGDEGWNHQCHICQRKFKCELYLKKHLKIHDPTPIIQQSLDTNQNEVSASPINLENGPKETDDVDDVLSSKDDEDESSKVGILNSIFKEKEALEGAVA